MPADRIRTIASPAALTCDQRSFWLSLSRRSQISPASGARRRF